MTDNGSSGGSGSGGGGGDEMTPATAIGVLGKLSSESFDFRTAIAGLYLWLLFGYLSSMVSCDLQYFMQTNVVFRQLVGLISFFLLFTIIDQSNELSVCMVWMKTVATYFVFLLMTKCKWYFSLPVLFLIVVDQSLKYEISFLSQSASASPQDKAYLQTYRFYRADLLYILVFLIVAGFLHYLFRQYTEFGATFSLFKLLFTFDCKKITPA